MCGLIMDSAVFASFLCGYLYRYGQIPNLLTTNTKRMTTYAAYSTIYPRVTMYAATHTA
jgi:hypothetical protein